MRVLQVGSSLFDWGGIERYVFYLARGLVDLGYEVDVSRPEGTPLAQRFPDGVAIASRRKLNSKALARYVRLFRRRRYDIVHVHYNPDFISVGLAARLSGVPRVVLTRHVAMPWPKWKSTLFSRMYDRIIPVSDAVKQRLLESGVPASKLIVAKAGCPALFTQTDLGSMRQSLGIPEDGFAVGCFGRLVPEKGLDILLEAAVRVSQDVSFEIFGSGPLERELEKQASCLGNVRLHGFRPQVADCMAAMDAVVIPSRWDEPFPYAALEAMSVGRPLIVSRVGGLPELVDPGVNGLVFERERVDGLVEAIDELKGHRGFATEMGVRGRDLHRSQFTVEMMAKRVESVYLG